MRSRNPARTGLLVVQAGMLALLASLCLPAASFAQPAPAPAAQAQPAKADAAALPADGATKVDAKPAKKHAKKEKKGFLEKLAPIAILLVIVVIVLMRVPKPKDVNHSPAYRKRRVLNWLPLGLTYMFLYMGRYNLKVSQSGFGEMRNSLDQPMMSNADFSMIFMIGTIVYGCAFVINGPLTDKFGGRRAILTGAAGALLANAAMGLCSWSLVTAGPGAQFIGDNFVVLFAALYAINMYFQSFGAVAIVKCNAPWFHVRERGIFGAIFGILISLGVYLAFDVGYMIIDALPLYWVFLVPTVALAFLWIADVFMVRNTPGEAGFEDFDTADASSGDDGPQLSTKAVFKKMLSNPIILTIAAVEFCSGFMRQSIMQWGKTFAKQTDGTLDLYHTFVFDNWGMLLCCAGIAGGLFAGVISDHFFQSRRGPVAAVLYALMAISAIVLVFAYDSFMIGWIVVFMSMCVIGVHGMLSGTASMDFGGKKNVGVVVGIIDGFVYLGTGVMSLIYMYILPSDSAGEAANPDNWIAWPLSMIPVAVIGFFLATRVWNAKPKGKGKGQAQTQAKGEAAAH